MSYYSVNDLAHILEVYEVNPTPAIMAEASNIAYDVLVVLDSYSNIDSMIAIENLGWKVYIDKCVCYPEKIIQGRVVGKNYAIPYQNKEAA